jgi:hypothetical protein
MSRWLVIGFMFVGLSSSTGQSYQENSGSNAQKSAIYSESTSAPYIIAQNQEPVVTSEQNGSAIAPDPGSKSDVTYLICKNNKLVRTLRVTKRSNGGCTATYTKEGVDQVVGNSWAVERCSRIINGIKDTLEKHDWKCKDISEARVSSLE